MLRVSHTLLAAISLAAPFIAFPAVAGPAPNSTLLLPGDTVGIITFLDIASRARGRVVESPCLATNVLVEPCREILKEVEDEVERRLFEEDPPYRDKYGIGYERIGPYRLYR